MRIQNKKHGIYRVNLGKLKEASRLGGLERVRGGEKVIIRARERERRRKTDLFKQTLKVIFHIITRAYELCLACQTLIFN